MTASTAALLDMGERTADRPAAAGRAAARALDLEPERLVRAYSDLILRLSYTYLRSTAEAEDICQDVLIKLIGRGQPFRNKEHERAWVIRVTANACKDLLRRDRSHPTDALDSVPEASAPPTVPEGAATERDRRVLAAVAALPQNYREAIYLHYYEGYSIRAIAALTGRSPAAVAQHLSRGRKRLRSTLEGDLDELDV